VIYPSWNWRKIDRAVGAEIYQGHFYSLDDASDLKVPWDLSSFFHLPPLAEAYWQTGDERYGREVLDQLRDWHAQNPFPRGAHWTCAMVVGIRLANLVFALRLLERLPGSAALVDEIGLLSVLTHVRFILDYLEVDEDGRRNNHYLNNLVGLTFGGSEVAADASGIALLDFVRGEVETELFTQFSPDGTHFEGSIPYHRFATESLLHCAILLEQNGRPLSPRSMEQFRRMLGFIDMYTKSNGLAPQIGDNDNGRILALGDYAAPEHRDHRDTLAVGASFLGIEPRYADVSDRSADTVWLLGWPAPGAPPIGRPRLAAGVYASNGYAVARTAESSLIVRCGQINPMSGGGHNHSDQLSLEYHDAGQDVLADPGALIYSGDPRLRNAFRATAAHNVLQLDDHEQQDFDPRDLFGMHDRCRATIDGFDLGAGTVTFRGHHQGYAEMGWRVEREIVWEYAAGCLRVLDTATPLQPRPGGKEFCGRLHLGAEVRVAEGSATELLLRSSLGAWKMAFSGNLRIGIGPGFVSPSYGVKLPAVVVEYRFPAIPGERASFAIARVEP